MGLSRIQLTTAERAKLKEHLEKHKSRPILYHIRKVINAANFTVADGAIGSYFTYSYTPQELTGVVSISANFIITPNTTVDIFALILSYKSTVTMADNGAAGIPDDEAGDIYTLLSNGGAINDFQVFWPLDWFLEKANTLYIQVYAGATTVTAGTSTITGRVVLGVLPVGQ